MTLQILRVLKQLLKSFTFYSETLKEIEKKQDQLSQAMKDSQFTSALIETIQRDFIVNSFVINLIEHYPMPGKITQFLIVNIIDHRDQCISFYENLQHSLQASYAVASVTPMRYENN